MDYAVREDGDAIHINMSGPFTFTDHDRFVQIMGLLEKTAGRQMIFDIQKLEMIDSSGLGMFIMASDAASRHQHRLHIRNARGPVRRILDLARFHQAFHIQE